MIAQLGAYPLFLGVETGGWSLATFQQAARTAKAIGFTALFVKIADGGNVWYSGNWQQVLESINAEGIHAIPYTYCYGNKFGAIESEINILKAAMEHSGIVVADMEVEMNSQEGWAALYTNALKPVSGLFGVTTWADPNLQAWNGVLEALRPCVNFWLPQVYSNYLASVYHAQYDPYGLPYYPILNLGTDAGANDPLSIAKSANSPVIGFWEYQAAISTWEPIAKEIIALHPTITIQEKPPMPIPANWHYDAATGTLTTPNSKYVVTGDFAKKLLSLPAWNATNVPLENAVHVNQCELHVHPPQAGIRQIFAESMLLDIPGRGVVASALGYEVAACYNVIASLEAQVAALKKAATPPTSGASVAITPLQALIANATLLEQEVVQALDVQKVTAQHVIDMISGK